jgi:hypothetical protein
MALEWRSNPPRPGDDSVVDMLRAGLLPLYHIFLADYENRLREYGQLDLARGCREWRRELGQNNNANGFPIPDQSIRGQASRE